MIQNWILKDGISIKNKIGIKKAKKKNYMTRNDIIIDIFSGFSC